MDRSDQTAELVTLLREFYPDDEAFKWLTLPQTLFDDAVPLDMIAAGRMGDLILFLRQVAEGVFL